MQTTLKAHKATSRSVSPTRIPWLAVTVTSAVVTVFAASMLAIAVFAVSVLAFSMLVTVACR